MAEKNNTNLKMDNQIDPVKKRTEKVLKAFSIVITLFLLMVLVVIKINIPTFPLVWFIIIFAILVIVGLTVFFISNVINFVKNRNKEIVKEGEKTPKPLTLGELRKICREALTNEDYCNHVKGCLGEKFITLKKSKNVIYVYKTESLYKNIGEVGIIYILINANFPDIKSILFDPSDYELKKTIDSMGTVAEDEPGEKVTRRTSPMLGIEEEVIERNPVIAETPEEKPKKEEIE